MKAMEEENKVLVADVVRHNGPGVSIAADMTLDDAITVLTRKRDEEEEMKDFSSTINAFPYDGAWALKLALEEMFGYVVNARCFCGQTHNRELQIVTDARGTKTSIPWGEFHVPRCRRQLPHRYSYPR
jgi:transitional endoplasmic reticulum ATPase